MSDEGRFGRKQRSLLAQLVRRKPECRESLAGRAPELPEARTTEPRISTEDGPVDALPIQVERQGGAAAVLPGIGGLDCAIRQLPCEAGARQQSLLVLGQDRQRGSGASNSLGSEQELHRAPQSGWTACWRR